MQRNLCLQTERLFLRPLTVKDAGRLQEIASVPEVARMMSSIAYPWSDEQVRDWINGSLWRGEVPFRLGICLRGGPLIGAVGYGGVDIAFFLGQDFWRQGYATEALNRFVGWLFLSFGIDQISAEHLNDNPASGAVLRKVGFSVEAQSNCKSMARVDAAPSTLYRLTRQVFEGRHEIS